MRGFLRGFLRQLSILLLGFLAYLIQVCFLDRISIGGATPNIMFVYVAVVTVCFGKTRAFWVGALYGMLMETMLTSVSLLNLFLYPAAALMGGVLLADKSEQRLEYLRSIGKPGTNPSPYWRTPCCAAVNALIYELVNLVYVNLRDNVLPPVLLGRALLEVLLTTLLTVLLMLPLRALFGRRYERKARPKPQVYRA